MKRIANILLLLMLFCMSGCLTKIYLGEPKIKQPTTSNYLEDDSPILGAINPTSIPAGGTWGTVRGVINTNFSNINGSLDSIEVTTAKHEADIDTLEQGYSDHVDSLAVHRTAINLRALKSDLTAKINVADSGKYVTPLALSTGLAGKQDVFTLKTINSQTLFGTGNIVIEGGEGGTMTWPAAAGIPLYDGASGWGTSIANNSTNWNTAYGWGNHASAGYAPLSHTQAQTTITDLPDSLLARYTKTQMDLILSNLATGDFDTTYIYHILDSIRAVLADSVNIEALLQIDFDLDTVASLSDVRSLAGSGVVGVTLNSGTLTLTGSDATADDITFYTNGNGEYNLPTGGGNLTIQSQVQGWISDSIAANLGGGGGADSSIYVTVTRLTDSLDVMRVLINDLIAVVENLGVDVSAPSIDSMEIGNFADDTLVIYFSEKLNTDSIPASSVFYLTEGVNEMGIASISLPNDTVMYVVLDSTALYGSTYLLDYTRAHPYLQDSTGNAIATFSNRSVINNMPEPSATGLLEGLIAYWDMQESSGNIVDEVASLAGVPASTAPGYSQTGRIGNAINFNYTPTYGSGTRFDVGDDLLQSNQVSISAWIYPTDSGDSFTIISNNASDYGYRFFCGGGGGGVAANVSDGSGHTASPDAGTLTINTWHHVVLVVNGTNVITYINGTQSDQEVFPYNIGYGSGSSVTIGSTYDNTLSFGGRIDELGIWSRALTTDEIAALYNTGSGLAYSSFGN